jgi:excinuclease ABC subunit B
VTSPGAVLIFEQIIRPTGLLDPEIEILPTSTQVDTTIRLCKERVASGERVLVTTLTKRTAEELADYLRDAGQVRVHYLHSDIDTIERVEILRGLRAGDCDVLVGVNLLREGLDLPEVSLVCILEADKEGFLRSQTSLIQTAGRAARHVNGRVVLFADTITRSIRGLLDVSAYRRAKQMAHNETHGITPQSVQRAVQESLHVVLKAREFEQSILHEDPASFDTQELLRDLKRDMERAAANLEYERAALLRDQIREIEGGETPKKTTVYPAKPRKKRRR